MVVFAEDDADDAQFSGAVVLATEVERGKTKSYYVNFPAALAEAAQIEKGEEFEWLVEDKNAFLLRRKKPKNSILKRSPPLT